MFKDVHHVSMYCLDLASMANFLEKYFGHKPLKKEEPTVARTVMPIAYIYTVGPSLMEFMQPGARYGMHYEYLRRNGKRPVISHIAWKVEKFEKRLQEVLSRGA